MVTCREIIFICSAVAELCILTELFLKESCFSDCSGVSLVVPVFKNVGERSRGKVYEKLVNNRIVDHLEK